MKEMENVTSFGDNQICVFTYEQDGLAYIAVDTYVYCNGSTVTLSKFHYDGNLLAYVQGAGYIAAGIGAYWIRAADESCADSLYCNDSTSLAESMEGLESWNGWATLREYYPDDYANQSATDTELQEFMSLYKDMIWEMGLNVDDARIGMDENTGYPDESYDDTLITAADAYTAKEESITFIAGVYTYTNYLSGNGRVDLYRQDYTGMLNEYR